MSPARFRCAMLLVNAVRPDASISLYSRSRSGKSGSNWFGVRSLSSRLGVFLSCSITEPWEYSRELQQALHIYLDYYVRN